MKILITGGAGYIGSVLTGLGLSRNHQVRAVDCLWFDQTIPLSYSQYPDYEFIRGDFTDPYVLESALEGVDLVIHTAAVVGDPASKKYPELTRKTNDEGTIALINKARAKGVRGFVFFSTCSNYGVADTLATEETPLKPLSLYAQTKVNVERYLIDSVSDMKWIIGRLSTVYGLSPRMRFDLTVNDFMMNAYRSKKLDIFFPESYRPYIHVFDLANVVLELAERMDSLGRQVFNIGFNGENYRKIQIANEVKRLVPDLNIEILKQGGDLRDYQVDFAKLSKVISYKPEFNVKKGLKKLNSYLQMKLIDDYDNPVFYNTSPRIPA